MSTVLGDVTEEAGHVRIWPNLESFDRKAHVTVPVLRLLLWEVVEEDPVPVVVALDEVVLEESVLEEAVLEEAVLEAAVLEAAVLEAERSVTELAAEAATLLTTEPAAEVTD